MLGAETMTIQLSDSEKLSNSFKLMMSKVYKDSKAKPYETNTVFFDSEEITGIEEANEMALEWASETYPNNDCIVQTIQIESCIYSKVIRFKAMESEEIK